MLRLVLGVAIAIGIRPDFQTLPVFKAEAYVVTNRVVFLSRDGKPSAGLTVADFSIVLDKRIAVPIGVEEDPDKPGYYLFSFNPPEALRDGKTHRVDLRLKGVDGKWRTLPLNWKASFAKPR